MSLEKAIQKLTQVIQAATPGMGVPDGSPIGREVISKKPKCVIRLVEGGTMLNPNITSDSPHYCNCYKEANPDFAGVCFYNCRKIGFSASSSNQISNVQAVPCEANGVPGVSG